MQSILKGGVKGRCIEMEWEMGIPGGMDGKEKREK